MAFPQAKNGSYYRLKLAGKHHKRISKCSSDRFKVVELLDETNHFLPLANGTRYMCKDCSHLKTNNNFSQHMCTQYTTRRLQEEARKKLIEQAREYQQQEAPPTPPGYGSDDEQLAESDGAAVAAEDIADEEWMTNLDPWLGVTLAMPRHILDGTAADNGQVGDGIVSPIVDAQVVRVHRVSADDTSYTTYVVNVANETGGIEEVLLMLSYFLLLSVARSLCVVASHHHLQHPIPA